MEIQNITGNISGLSSQTALQPLPVVYYINKPNVSLPKDTYILNKTDKSSALGEISQKISLLANNSVIFINKKINLVKENNTKSLLMEFLALKDPNLKIHSQSVEKYSTELAQRLNLPETEIKNIAMASALHDLGKMYVPAPILQKPGKLNDQEQAIMEKHPVDGSNILGNIPGIPKAVGYMVKHHHEKWDGSGYPDKLSGNEIPLAARIISIADAFDAMTSNRDYRKALPIEEAVERLKAGAGTQWDPFLVDKFVEMILSKQQG
jgi:HD-GYP domain-containing protein (c-di-GMP phosphodiesterase class II)